VRPAPLGALVGVAVALLAGAVLGGPWWVAALAGAAGALSGRTGGLVQAVATLVLVGGAAGAGATWLVPPLVAGVVTTAELGAAVEVATTSVRPHDLAAPAGRAAAAAAASAGLLALAGLGPGPSVVAALVAGAAGAATLAAARP